MVKIIKSFGFFAVLLLATTSCLQPQGTSRDGDSSGSSSTKYLYVATGACYSGTGNTTFTSATSSNLIYRINLTDGSRDSIIADYWSSPSNPGDSPSGLALDDNNDVLALVENSTASLRRIEKITNEAYGSRQTYNNYTTALSAQLRKLRRLSDGWLLVSKSTDIEKVKDGTNRILNGANAFIHLAATASSCITSNTLLSDMISIPNSGLIVFLHATAAKTGFGVISSTGYAAAADCKNNAFQTSPAATAYPTAAVYDSTNQKLIVAFAGNSTAANVNSIYAYNLDPTTGAISSPQKIYDANQFGSTWNYLLYGISAMEFDSSTNSLYVSTAITNSTTVANYKIEKLKYDPTQIGSTNANVLLKDYTIKDYGSDTKCISQMLIGN